MAQKKAHEAEAFLKNKPQSYSVILLYGPDKGLAAEYAALFAKNSGADLQDPFALLKLDGDVLEKDPSRLIDEAQTIALFGGKRLIWIAYQNSGAKNAFSEAVKFLLANPPQDCFILLQAGDLKKGVFLRKIIEDSPQGMALPCYGDEGRALQNLIAEMLAQFNLTISDEARALLQENLGADRRISRSELEKLCLYAQNKTIISADDVRDSVSGSRALAQDDIANAVLCGDIAAFNSSFDSSLTAGAPSFLPLAALMRQFQQMQDFRFQMEEQGQTAAAAVAAARPPVFFKRKKIMEQALALWNSAKIARAQERLHKTLLESRQNSALSAAIIRQNLLALTVEAARSRRG